MSDGGQPGFGIAHVLRPFPTFADEYQGVAASTPIMFTEGGEPLDAQAGEPGYSARLLRGLAVPAGARVLAWLPSLFAISNPLIPYTWHAVWRLRTTFDYRQERQPFHIAKQGEGVPDTSVPAGQQARVVIPAAHHVAIYSQSETGLGTFAMVTANIRGENVSTRGPDYPLPLLPGGQTGYFQQGLRDPGAVPAIASIPEFLPYDIPVLGDELLISCVRPTDAVGQWSFATADLPFAEQFGDATGTTFPDIGVYIMIGKTS
jgi:hypothetical protein